MVISQTELPDLGDLHTRQWEIWENEHACPEMFPNVDSNVADPGVVRFWEHLHNKTQNKALKGLELCCGKGRNAIWLAEYGAKMVGFDFSKTAIGIAEKFQQNLPADKKVTFMLHDALVKWPFESGYFDFIIDCFGTADIESARGRDFVIDEAARVLKKGGLYFMQIDSPEQGLWANRLKSHPGPDKNTLVFPNGKIESVLTKNDIADWDQHYPLKIEECQTLIEHNVEICGSIAPYEYFWIIMRLPL